MDPRLLDAYNRELAYLRAAGKEFGEENQEVAGRLGLNNREDPDPYVERLLEGVAFLSARVHLKLEDQFPEFTQHLLQAIQPDYLAPTPSMCILAFEPDTKNPDLASGVTVPRHSQVVAQGGRGDSPCTFRTAHAFDLLPLRIVEVTHLPNRAAVAAASARAGVVAESGLRIRMETTGGADLSAIRPGPIPIFIDGAESLPGGLYHQILGETLAVVATASGAPSRPEVLSKPQAVGFADSEALLPTEGRSFRGYRLVREYFSFPERFLFFTFADLERAFAGGGQACEIVLLFSSASSLIEGVSAANLRLFCTPAINLFEKQLGRTPVRKFDHEHLVMPDRTRPNDYEVYRILEVVAHFRAEESRPVAPLYAFGALLHDWSKALFHTTRMRPRKLSRRQQQSSGRSDYSDTETLISLAAPGAPDLVDRIHDLSVRALVTNRELPEMLRGQPEVEVTSAEGVKVAILRGPTRPRRPLGLTDAAWRVIGGLTANHASLVDQLDGDPSLLRDHLGLYGAMEGAIDGAATRRQIDGIQSVTTEPVHRRMVEPADGRRGRGAAMTFIRGQRIRILLDDTAFDRGRMYMFAAVVDRFLSEFAAVNSFVETVFESPNRGDFAKWPPRMGLRPTI